jgi:hypothetical protein
MDINFNQQFVKFWRIILILILILNIFLLAVFGLSSLYSLPIMVLLEDPASVYKASQFAGFLTYMGVIVLAAGLGAVILVLSFSPYKKVTKKEFLAVSLLGLISLYLILDDLFLIHERILTGLFHVGERRIFLVYLLCFTGYLAYFRKQIFTGPTIFLFIALLFLGSSLAVDFFTDKVPMKDAIFDTMEMLEEGAKIGGFLFWTAFIILRVKGILNTEFGSGKD